MVRVKDSRRFNQDGSSKSDESETPQKGGRRKLQPSPTKGFRNKKRARKERRRVVAYRVVPLYDAKTRAEWPESVDWIIEGELEDHLILSVPVTTSMAMIKKFQDELTVQFGKPVCIMTHNMELLVAKRLPQKEAAKAVKRIEDYAEERESEIKKAAEAIDAEAEANENDNPPSGVGDGPDPHEAVLDE